jgi:hypothetical protein
MVVEEGRVVERLVDYLRGRNFCPSLNLPEISIVFVSRNVNWTAMLEVGSRKVTWIILNLGDEPRLLTRVLHLLYVISRLSPCYVCLPFCLLPREELDMSLPALLWPSYW